ncbi:MAG TPA: alginate lyase family protein [Chthoniobacteraceae bacterium]
MISLHRFLLIFSVVVNPALSTRAATINESEVPAYTLPDPLTMADGKKVTTPQQWLTQRRPELLEIATREMYGQAPARPEKMSFEILETDPQALGGLATRRQVRVLFTGEAKGPQMDLLLYIPHGAVRPVPAILGLNFEGNHAIHADPKILLASSWMDPKSPGVVENKATEASRGTDAKRWAVEMILKRGYALVTAYRGDIDPDFDDQFKNGIHAAYPKLQGRGDNFATIAAWAWGMSRALDYLETDLEIDSKRVAAFGWSRLGTAALWAGATDRRFAAVLSNESGAGGAALSKRKFGEDVERLNRVFPHWFCGNFRKYDQREEDLPFDQHSVLALIAPRPVCLGNAVEDKHADPKGEFLALKAAEPVYKLLGAEGLPIADWPPANQPALGHLGYFLRPGRHDVTADDWTQYLAFADRHLGKKTSAKATPFKHPGILHDAAELDFVRAKVREQAEPWKSAWEELRKTPVARLDWKPQPVAQVTRGPGNNPNIGAEDLERDASAAYTHALQWWITKDPAHAIKAATILNGWASQLKTVLGHDARLLVGMAGLQLVNAAELLRHSEANWEKAAQADFEKLLRQVLLPLIKDFYPTANGNWDAAMLQTMLAMAVFLDDRDLFDRAVDYSLNGVGNGRIGNYLRASGECQESGRDQAHTQMGLGYLGCAAEIAWKQGVDLYGALGNRLAAGFEYTARYNLGHDVPYERFQSVEGRYDNRAISKKGRGKFRPIYERVYHHYHDRRGLELPFTRQVVEKMRPEKWSIQHAPWGTLLCVGDPAQVQRAGKGAAALPLEGTRQSPQRPW